MQAKAKSPWLFSMHIKLSVFIFYMINIQVKDCCR